MGFTSGFYKGKRYKDITPKQLSLISSYISFENNKWHQENGIKWEDEHPHSPVPSEDALSFYRPEYKPREYESSILTTVEEWCSNGRQFDDWFRERLGMAGSEFVAPQEVTRDVLLDALEMVNQEMDKYVPKPVVVTYAGTIDEDNKITLIPCNCIEVEDQDGNIKREHCNDWEYSELCIAGTKYIDSWEYPAWPSLRDAIVKMLKETDFENEIIIYESSW